MSHDVGASPNPVDSRPLTDDRHSEDTQHAAELQRMTNDLQTLSFNHTEDVAEATDPISDVFNIPELLVLILSRLPMKDLTHALSVSRHWQTVTLDSIDLRRKLSLEPAPPKEYIEHRDDQDPECYSELATWQPVVVYEPHKLARLIVEPHPVIASRCDPKEKIYVDLKLPDVDELKTVPAATLLTQPPLNDISIYCDILCDSSCRQFPGGVTFGVVVEIFEAMLEYYEEKRAWAERETARDPGLAGDLRYLVQKPTIHIRASGVVASVANVVEIAREAAVRNAEFLRLESLDQEQSDGSP